MDDQRTDETSQATGTSRRCLIKGIGGGLLGALGLAALGRDGADANGYPTCPYGYYHDPYRKCCVMLPDKHKNKHKNKKQGNNGFGNGGNDGAPNGKQDNTRWAARRPAGRR